MTTQTKNATIWDLLTGDDVEATHRWLKWHPSEIDACVEARGHAMPDPLTPGELEEIREAHTKWKAPEASLEAIARLGEANVRVTIAGQQPGLLGGPFYSVYKAIGAIKLARALGERHPDLKFVPVFWVGSEDHDFDEVRRLFWPSSSGALDEMLIDHPDWEPGRMLGTLKCGSLGERICDRVKATTFETEYRPAALDAIREAYGPDQTWEDAFCRIFLSLFPDSGLVVVSPLMRWVRRRAAGVLAAEARAAGRSSTRIIERGAELTDAGFESTLHRRPDAVNFFHVDERDRRHPIRIAEGRIEAIPPAAEGSEEKEPIPLAESPEALAAKVAENPEAFSFNVVTRPMVQDSILPTVAQMIGPGEAAYLAQVEAVCGDFGVFMPVRYPRPRVLLVQNNVARALKKYGLTIEEVVGADSLGLARGVLERDLGQGVLLEVRELDERQRAELKEMETRIEASSAVADAVQRLAQAMERGYETIIDRILYGREKDQRHLREAMARIEHNVSPNGKPQERVFNPIAPFAFNYGPDWVAKLEAAVDHDPTLGVQYVSLAELAKEPA